MNMQISEVQVTPIKPNNGLIGFASLVFDNSLYLGGIGIYTRPSGGFRLTYPTRKSLDGQIHLFHPINRAIALHLEQVVTKKIEDVMNVLNVSDQHASNEQSA